MCPSLFPAFWDHATSSSPFSFIFPQLSGPQPSFDLPCLSLTHLPAHQTAHLQLTSRVLIQPSSFSWHIPVLSPTHYCPPSIQPPPVPSFPHISVIYPLTHSPCVSQTVHPQSFPLATLLLVRVQVASTHLLCIGMPLLSPLTCPSLHHPLVPPIASVFLSIVYTFSSLHLCPVAWISLLLYRASALGLSQPLLGMKAQE